MPVTSDPPGATEYTTMGQRLKSDLGRGPKDTNLSLDGSVVPLNKRPQKNADVAVPASKPVGKPVAKNPDVMGAFRDAAKGLQVVKGLASSRSPSKGGR
jgi:hypothetical protein